MAKLADATDLGSVGVTHGGSSPLRPTLFPLVLNSFFHDTPHDLGRTRLCPILPPMVLGFPKSGRWIVLTALTLFTFASPLHAMDEETTKTIADLKAQMQSLMDEVKKLKSQQSNNPSVARLRPPSPEPTDPNKPPPRLHLSPLAILLFLPQRSRIPTANQCSHPR